MTIFQVRLCNCCLEFLNLVKPASEANLISGKWGVGDRRMAVSTRRFVSFFCFVNTELQLEKFPSRLSGKGWTIEKSEEEATQNIS